LKFDAASAVLELKYFECAAKFTVEVTKRLIDEIQTMKTKLNLSIFAVAASAVVLTGCVDPNGQQNNTGTGALIGGALGAITGAAIGGPRHGGEGALIGAAAGLIAGGAVGNSMDQQQQAQLRAQAPQSYVRVVQGQPLSTADVKALAKAGVSDDVIISHIQGSHTAFQLSAADIIDLHNSGVSDRVVNFMISTRDSVGAAQSTTMVVQEAPPPPLPETVVVERPEPGYAWVGGEWVWNGGWFWRAGYWAYRPGGIWVEGGWHQGPRGWYHSPGYWRR
jgi:outer membrane lipoprotein SlyB